VQSFLPKMMAGMSEGTGPLAGASPVPWTPWFHDIAWDATFVVQDMTAKHFVPCMSDPD